MNDSMGVLERRITRTSYWIDGFKQIRLQLVQDALAHMQNVTNSLLPQFGLEGWLVEYATERETKAGKISQGLTVTILKPGMKKGVKWESWSGGEGQRLLIAGALAFSQVILERSGIECDFLVLDEPTRHMSREGVSDTVDALLEWSRDKQTFYTDHQAIESNRFTSVVTITKDEHGSRIDVQR